MANRTLIALAGGAVFSVGIGAGWFALKDGANPLQISAPKVEEGHYLNPAYLTKFDFMSPGDHYYSRLAGPFLQGDEPGDWSIFDRIKSYLGRKVAEVITAPKIAELITTSFPIEGQEAAKEITEVVADCAAVLGVEPPAIFIRNEPIANAYVATNAEGDTYLVMTSGLLELFEAEPRELRFVIGHELGHVKCSHGRGNGVAKAVIAGISTLVPDDSLGALPPVGLGYLLSWNREAEFSADRAGLLCCQDLDVALQALMRLQHGIRPDSRWIDTEIKFDADRALGEFEKWEDEPFVKFVRKVKSVGSSHPFMDERLAALKWWGEGQAYPQILARLRMDGEGGGVDSYRIRTVQVEPGGEAKSATSFVKFYVGDTWGFELNQAESASWSQVDRVLDVPRGCPVFLDVWEAGWWTGSFGDERLGLAMLVFEEGKLNYRIPVARSVSERVEGGEEPHVLVELERIAAN